MRVSRCSFGWPLLMAAATVGGCSSSSGCDSVVDASRHGTFMMGLPMAWTSTFDGRILQRCAGLESTECDPGIPSVDAERFLDDVLPPDYADVSPILAMSIAYDTFHMLDATATDEGIVIGVPDELAWTALHFTVNPGQVDAVADGPIAPAVQAAITAGTAGASLFTYMLPEAVPSTFPCENPALNLAPSQMGLAADDEILGMNMHLALFLDQVGLTGWGSSFFADAIDEGDVALYFTLRPEVLDSSIVTGRRTPIAQLIAAWGISSVPPLTQILRSVWDPVCGEWGTPTLWHDLKDLLPIGVDEKDGIDSLTMHRFVDGNGALRYDVLWSPGPTASVDDQLLHTRFGEYGVDEVGNGTRRRVLIREGSVESPAGRRLGAGRGLGDTCSSDPSLRVSTLQMGSFGSYTLKLHSAAPSTA